MKSLKIPVLALLTSLLLVTGACVNVKQGPPEKRYYALTVTRAAKPDSNGTAYVLRVKPFRVSALYEDKGFVYRDGELNYISDFYNEFLVSPGPMLTGEVVKWLNASKVFKTVLDTPSQVLPEYVLEGAVTSLYGDFRDLKNPKAVMEIQFFLIAADLPKAGVVAQGQFRKELAITSPTASALVKGWNDALVGILIDFENMLTAQKL
jgi:cholesterol transport system auxiliary component